ncbi:MAG: hypothetical protein A3G32_04950 [Deltaproteobacteria bacterium RIFCSPLOWO2_12_FULL_40_28]|nr:MAG: hypothetical protein A3C45_09060 [Deltaproteobacteria bacterium RIFCSPHIGHO2_02_FULL_40_28]OGQ19713.1 MAG: hypothetical protein A3E27_08255 [Deltaproteobacteria bacterium RIFCSPHIGHO2_12_FULL_40_32]OGQ40990.1 MAG: hypothetical protein A3I69_03670 [Deltaproteobacteria bacterium RIFCSPLOWO2_02_FULL_40_36]OGQ54106.1 MAG: hypothetical protein A3G32_04950 [Deltaproteobacteria bacterium RIFCSPLOWO2_12_FULL_40_28]
MIHSIQRIKVMFLRYFYLHRRSVSRTLELFFWPVMELLVWGFMSIYIQTIAGPVYKGFGYIINGMIFWDVLYRSQQGVTLSIVEDIWSQNIVNLLISPLKLWEWMVATFLYGVLKTMAITTILAILALLLYHFNLVGSMGLKLVPFMGSLLLFGWGLGVLTSGLLIRWGNAVQALIWGIPFLIQPFSAIYYPLSILPEWAQFFSRLIPSTFIFEGVRSVLDSGQINWGGFWISIIFNMIFFIFASMFFYWMYFLSRISGRLGRLGMD